MLREKWDVVFTVSKIEGEERKIQRVKRKFQSRFRGG